MTLLKYIQVIHDKFGILEGLMSTVHSMTGMCAMFCISFGFTFVFFFFFISKNNFIEGVEGLCQTLLDSHDSLFN